MSVSEYRDSKDVKADLVSLFDFMAKEYKFQKDVLSWS
jgi:hypothetical protein